MKSEFELYMETGILGGYVPERVIGFQEEDKITPIYRDTSYHETENGMELRREIITTESKLKHFEAEQKKLNRYKFTQLGKSLFPVQSA